MAQKDILEKILMAHGDVFADCVNVFLYGGQPKLRGGFMSCSHGKLLSGRQGSAASSATGAFSDGGRTGEGAVLH